MSISYYFYKLWRKYETTLISGLWRYCITCGYRLPFPWQHANGMVCRVHSLMMRSNPPLHDEEHFSNTDSCGFPWFYVYKGFDGKKPYGFLKSHYGWPMGKKKWQRQKASHKKPLQQLELDFMAYPIITFKYLVWNKDRILCLLWTFAQLLFVRQKIQVAILSKQLIAQNHVANS